MTAPAWVRGRPARIPESRNPRRPQFPELPSRNSHNLPRLTETPQ